MIVTAGFCLLQYFSYVTEKLKYEKSSAILPKILYRRIWRISRAGVELLGGKISGKIVHNLFTCNNNSFLDFCEFVLPSSWATKVHESNGILQNKRDWFSRSKLVSELGRLRLLKEFYSFTGASFWHREPKLVPRWFLNQ
jgi:hypothetical protein